MVGRGFRKQLGTFRALPEVSQSSRLLAFGSYGRGRRALRARRARSPSKESARFLQGLSLAGQPCKIRRLLIESANRVEGMCSGGLPGRLEGLASRGVVHGGCWHVDCEVVAMRGGRNVVGELVTHGGGGRDVFGELADGFRACESWLPPRRRLARRL